MQNIQPLYKIQNLITLSQHCTLLSFQVSHFNKSDFLSNKLNLKNDQDKNIKCSYCGETLPNLLPSKVSEYLNDILMEKKSTHTIVEQYEFCLVYKGEETIISCGIEKGYPLYIDFAKLYI
uniref:Uncharacterized protein n=1 Tax=Rhizophagus irregularis (strain DAOM 181602 / DAOM 197198 / MUCL 43194) TaxID=747089 RepID=U9SIU7_RHIID